MRDRGRPDVAAERLRIEAALAGEADGGVLALDRLASLPAEARAEILDPELSERAVAALGHRERRAQRRAADALARAAPGAPHLAAALQRALGSNDARLRWGAAFALARAGVAGAATWPAIREALAASDSDLRWAAADLACRLARSEPEVHASLVACLEAAEAELRKMALYCLRELGDPELAGPARALLADPAVGVRLAALSAVSRLGRSRLDAEAVASRLRIEPAPGVRRAAAAALGRIGVAAPGLDALLAAAESASDDPGLARAARASRSALRSAARPSPEGRSR